MRLGGWSEPGRRTVVPSLGPFAGRSIPNRRVTRRHHLAEMQRSAGQCLLKGRRLGPSRQGKPRTIGFEHSGARPVVRPGTDSGSAPGLLSCKSRPSERHDFVCVRPRLSGELSHRMVRVSARHTVADNDRFNWANFFVETIRTSRSTKAPRWCQIEQARVIIVASGAYALGASARVPRLHWAEASSTNPSY
jgi:hypothetical protein